MHGVAILKVCDHESFVGPVPSQPNNTLQLTLGACNAWEGLSIIMQIMKFHVQYHFIRQKWGQRSRDAILCEGYIDTIIYVESEVDMQL